MALPVHSGSLGVPGDGSEGLGMSIEKAAEAIIDEMTRSLRPIPREVAFILARAALPHLLEEALREPTNDELVEAWNDAATDLERKAVSWKDTEVCTLRNRASRIPEPI